MEQSVIPRHQVHDAQTSTNAHGARRSAVVREDVRGVIGASTCGRGSLPKSAGTA